MAILDWFPFGDPRSGQIEALEFIEAAVFEGFKDIVIEAPTGIGKSAIGACASYWMSNEVDAGCDPKAYYLVTQKLLQEQMRVDIARYKKSCGDGSIIKTSADYSCDFYGNCGAGSRSQKGCPAKKSGNCNYTNNKVKFLSSSFGVTNYSYFFSVNYALSK